MLSKAFTTRQVAELAHVSQSTIANWISAGILPAFRTPGGHHRILPRDFVRFLEDHGFPVPDELQVEAGLKLLVIDDDPASAKRLAEELVQLDQNIELSVAEGGVEGILRIGLERPDVVLLDLHLPDLPAAEICRQLRLKPETQRTLILALSARRSDQFKQSAQKMGVARVFFKPVDAQEILDGLRELRRAHRPSISPRG
jgi:excisionase family DNA binding protein